MSNNLKGKRLLVLGGQLKLCDVVNRAKELGVYTIVTDWYDNSPAKSIADKAYDISTSDVDALLQLIHDERIDGVFTGFIDSTLPYYYEVCQRADLPCYLNKKTLECGTNKVKFKEACWEAGIHVIPAVDLKELKGIRYPIIIKPADNSGSKGITVCYNEQMIPSACQRAMRFSKTKSFISEQFLDCDYVCAYYIVRDGDAQLSVLMDKDMNHIGRGVIPYPTAFVGPSKYTEQYLRCEDSKVKRLIRNLNFQNGTFLISFFVNGTTYYAVEMSARLTATREYLIIKDAIGVDTLEMHINMALTGEFTCAGQERSKLGKDTVYCMLFTFLKDGVIGKVCGIEEIRSMPGVQDVLQLREIGSKIRADGSYGQLFSRIHLKTTDPKEMVQLISKIEDTLQVISSEGKSMVLPGINAEKFFQDAI